MWLCFFSPWYNSFTSDLLKQQWLSILIEQNTLQKWPIAHVLRDVPVTVHPTVLPVQEHRTSPPRPAMTHPESDVSRNGVAGRSEVIFSMISTYVYKLRDSLQASDATFSMTQFRQLQIFLYIYLHLSSQSRNLIQGHSIPFSQFMCSNFLSLVTSCIQKHLLSCFFPLPTFPFHWLTLVLRDRQVLLL